MKRDLSNRVVVVVILFKFSYVSPHLRYRLHSSSILFLLLAFFFSLIFNVCTVLKPNAQTANSKQQQQQRIDCCNHLRSLSTLVSLNIYWQKHAQKNVLCLCLCLRIAHITKAIANWNKWINNLTRISQRARVALKLKMFKLHTIKT